ncbi:MAG: hypothetical protein JXB39_11140 [Deltaproteobacteria bacterium]|nr:hypothetical protein [Deltaproteobacteria bacterium]
MPGDPASSRRARRSTSERLAREALALHCRNAVPGDDGGLVRAGGVRRGAAVQADRWTHGFHTWPAGLDPDAAALLVRSLPDGPVGDPFCGGGTVLVEALAAGRSALGWDLAPVAVRLARVRACLADEPLLTAFRGRARAATDRARTGRDLPPESILRPLAASYEAHVLRELESLRRACQEAPPEVQPLMWACFSAILVKASYRRSDTVARRVPHHRPPGTTAVLFHRKARELARRLAALREAVPPDTPPPVVVEADARRFSAPEPLAGIVTSPPYPGVYDYLPMQHLRHVWLDLAPSEHLEMGSRRAFRKDPAAAREAWRADTAAWMHRAATAIRPGGRLVLVIGDGFVRGRTVGVADPIAACAPAVGLDLLARATAERPGPPSGRPRFEHVLVFERPDQGV